MLTLKTLKIKNFMSFGNVQQCFNLNSDHLTLVLGENLDIPSNTGGNSRNGVGKTGIVNALCFALFGQSLSNIRKDNLINFINEKNMEVELIFEKNNNEYRIHRGRKPNKFNFFINNKLANNAESDESQGEGKETQHEIEKIIGFSYEMFKQIVGLNTYSLPFLSLKEKDQRDIIEELLGITLLSEKAEIIKESLKDTNRLIADEEIRIKTIKHSNDMIGQTIDNLRSRQESWSKTHDNKINSLHSTLEELFNVDIDKEIEAHNINTKITEKETLQTRTKKSLLQKETQINDVSSRLKSYTTSISKLVSHKECPTCGHSVSDDKHEQIHNDIAAKQEKLLAEKATLETEITQLKQELTELSKEIDSYGIKTIPFYKSLAQAYEHKSLIDSTAQTLEDLLQETNPYNDDLIAQQQQLIQVVDLENLHALSTLREHQEFMVKLLTNKDSSVRKNIIDQNLGFLNIRLKSYVERLGLPHSIIFKNDLSVDISDHGISLDFDNLSRGEKTRLILGLSFAFRDVFESLNSSINVLFLDEIIDLGIDGAGLENALEILKKMSREMNRCIFLVSHREELIPRVNNIMTIVKENGFSSVAVENE